LGTTTRNARCDRWQRALRCTTGGTAGFECSEEHLRRRVVARQPARGRRAHRRSLPATRKSRDDGRVAGTTARRVQRSSLTGSAGRLSCVASSAQEARVTTTERTPRFFWEDFPEGSVREFGNKTVTRESIIAFAREFDPQPFHVDEDAAKRSLFGGLCASG